MYFATFTTTQLRNSDTSLLYITMNISNIVEDSITFAVHDYRVFFYINFPLIVILAILELFVLKYDTGKLKCQEIEMIIFNNVKNYRG